MKKNEAIKLADELQIKCNLPKKRQIDIPTIQLFSEWFDDSEGYSIVFVDSTLNSSHRGCIKKIADEKRKGILRPIREGVKYLIVFTPKKIEG